MTIDFEGVNWLAVLVAGAATFFLGGVWYQALFGKLWKKLHGFTDEQVKALHAKRPPALFFGGMLVAYLVLAAVMALLMGACHIERWQDGVAFGLMLWLGPALA